MTDILMPALSPTMEDGVLTKWHIKVGDTVSAGDVIAEIETDKATMEVEAVDEGVVTELLVAAGTEGVKVNTPIARLQADGEAARPAAVAPVAAPTAAASTPAPAPIVPAAPKAPAAAAVAIGAPRVFASPLARRLAGQKGVDLASVTGTGPHGRIIAADIAAASPGPAKAVSATPTAAGSRPSAKTARASKTATPAAAASRQVLSLEQMGIAPGSYDLVPLDGMRRTIARRLTDSFRDVPHFPLNIDLEIDRLLDARARINGALEARKIKVSVNDLIIKAAAAALKGVPEANASFTPDGIALHHHADIAVAVAIDGGLITPIIRHAEDRSLADIAVSMKDLAERARTRKLKPEEFQGGTFSISNLGMMGIRSFASIINEPQGCILSVGAGEKRPVVRGDQLAIATVMSVTLTCDHRVVDGAIGARFLTAFKGFVEDPVTLLA